MSTIPLPTNRAAAKVPPILAAARELGELRLNCHGIEGLEDGTGADRLLSQIHGIAELLRVSLATVDEDGPIPGPSCAEMEAAAEGIKTLALLASFADCASSYQSEETLAAVLKSGGLAQ